MRKTTIISIIVLAALAVGTWLFLANPFNSDLGLVRNSSQTFMEDLQFKDFRSSSLYHHKLEKDRVDIGRTLEKLFMVKPEMLDIKDYRIVKADIDSTGDRARVLVESRFRRLNYDEEPQTGEIILYWMKRHPDCPIGGTCSQGTCVNETDQKILRADYENKKNDQAAKARNDQEKTGAENLPEDFRCDPMAEKQWYMNLDSTLKEKRYNY